MSYGRDPDTGRDSGACSALDVYTVWSSTDTYPVCTLLLTNSYPLCGWLGWLAVRMAGVRMAGARNRALKPFIRIRGVCEPGKFTLVPIPFVDFHVWVKVARLVAIQSLKVGYDAVVYRMRVHIDRLGQVVDFETHHRILPHLLLKLFVVFDCGKRTCLVVFHEKVLIGFIPCRVVGVLI